MKRARPSADVEGTPHLVVRPEDREAIADAIAELPSGEIVVAFLAPRQVDRVRVVVLEWSSPPPLRAEDLIHYTAVVKPAVIRRVAEYLEILGPAIGLEIQA